MFSQIPVDLEMLVDKTCHKCSTPVEKHDRHLTLSTIHQLGGSTVHRGSRHTAALTTVDYC